MTWYKIKTPKMKMYKSFKEYRPVQPNMLILTVDIPQFGN